MTPLDTAPKVDNVSTSCSVQGALAENIASTARRLNDLREAWLNPTEWVNWTITPEEQKVFFPKRPIPKPGHENDLKKRTLTNLYNARPAWLSMAHEAIDKAVAAAYGWTDYTPAMSDDEILKRLLALNLSRATTSAAETPAYDKETDDDTNQGD